MVIEVWEEFTSMIFKGKENNNDNKLIPAIQEYNPKNFSILEENKNDHMYGVIYIDENNEEIFYEQRVLSYGEILLDTENIEDETIGIDNQTNRSLHSLIIVRTKYGGGDLMFFYP